MKPGEAFEIRCQEYLTKVYGKKGLTFYRDNSMNSTKSDIEVMKNGITDYFIEVKDTTAQSGQFVLLPDEDTRTFIFSPRNHSNPNTLTEIMIRYMNQYFDQFNNAGTAGQPLNIDSTIFSNWIIGHYKAKNVKYMISYDNNYNNYVIFPIRKFATYFDVLANYRIKKSGSNEPAQKDIPMVTQVIKDMYPHVEFSMIGKKLFVTVLEHISKDRFVLGKYTYYFSEQRPNYYEIRRLSNTYNMNVIFSIQLKCSQNYNDLLEFEADL